MPAALIVTPSKVWLPELLATRMPFFWLEITAAWLPGTVLFTTTSPAALVTEMPSPVSMKGWPALAVSVTVPPSVSLTASRLLWVLTIVPLAKLMSGAPPSTITEPLVMPVMLTSRKTAPPVALSIEMPVRGPGPTPLMFMLLANAARLPLDMLPEPEMPTAEFWIVKLLAYRPSVRLMLAPVGLESTGTPLVATAMLSGPQQTVGIV